jgi:protein-tyrosine phosphatase
VNVSDLFVATTYYWQVTGKGEAGEETSDVFTFKTAQSPRTIYLEGISNTRDIGGYVTEDGKRVKQGMAYRAATLDGVTQRGMQKAHQTYSIKTDLDLRRPAEGTAGSKSPLGCDNYINISSPYYLGGENGIDIEKNFEAMANIMRTFSVKENYPIMYHCSVGRDRTGMVSILLLGLLGVEYLDIALDYELSFFSERGCVDGASVEMMMRQFKSTYHYLMGYARNDGFQASCEAYLTACGLTKNEIAAIRENLLQ